MTADFVVLAAETAYRTSTMEEVTFWVLAVFAVLGALAVVAAPKAVYSAIFLAQVMIILAVLYIAQDALFLGIVQVVVYTGAVMMLFLFVLMLVGVDSADSLVETLRGQRIAAVLAGLALNAGLGWWWADPIAGYLLVCYGARSGPYTHTTDRAGQASRRLSACSRSRASMVARSCCR